MTSMTFKLDPRLFNFVCQSVFIYGIYRCKCSIIDYIYFNTFSLFNQNSNLTKCMREVVPEVDANPVSFNWGNVGGGGSDVWSLICQSLHMLISKWPS